MRKKEDDEEVRRRQIERVANAVNGLSEKEAKKFIDRAMNITFNEITAKMKEMDKVAMKDKWTDEEFKQMVEFSTLLYSYILICRGTAAKFSSHNFAAGLTVAFLRLGGK